MRILLLSILAFLALPSAGQEAGEDAALARLLEVVRTQRDRTTRQTFNDLARKGDPASFEALLTAIGWLRRPAALADAYNAFWFFRGNEGLARRALEFLSEQALEGPARYEAVYPLSHFAAAGQAALLRLVAVSRDADVRQKAMHHALGGLLASGEESALRLVLA